MNFEVFIPSDFGVQYSDFGIQNSMFIRRNGCRLQYFNILFANTQLILYVGD